MQEGSCIQEGYTHGHDLYMYAHTCTMKAACTSFRDAMVHNIPTDTCLNCKRQSTTTHSEGYVEVHASTVADMVQ